jgi:hypothetical protein
MFHGMFHECKDVWNPNCLAEEETREDCISNYGQSGLYSTSNVVTVSREESAQEYWQSQASPWSSSMSFFIDGP